MKKQINWDRYFRNADFSSTRRTSYDEHNDKVHPEDIWDGYYEMNFFGEFNTKDYFLAHAPKIEFTRYELENDEECGDYNIIGLGEIKLVFENEEVEAKIREMYDIDEKEIKDEVYEDLIDRELDFSWDECQY